MVHLLLSIDEIHGAGLRRSGNIVRLVWLLVMLVDGIVDMLLLVDLVSVILVVDMLRHRLLELMRMLMLVVRVLMLRLEGVVGHGRVKRVQSKSPLLLRSQGG